MDVPEYQVVEGEPSPVPLFKAELAYVESESALSDVVTTTAAFDKHGALVAFRSYWKVDLNGRMFYHAADKDSQFSTNDISLGDSERFMDSLPYGWYALMRGVIIPDLHKAILAHWLKSRFDWSLDV